MWTKNAVANKKYVFWWTWANESHDTTFDLPTVWH